MNNFDKKKVLTAVVACALVLTAVSIAERVPAVSGFLQASPEKSGTAGAVGTPNGAGRAAARLPAAASATQKININTAPAGELDALTGVGPSKAAAIVSYRNANGPFYRVEDIMKVKGIGQTIFDGIRNDITVGDISPPPEKSASAQLPASPASSAPTSSAPQVPALSARVIVTAVMAGIKGNAAYEYIELYNPDADLAPLTGWSIKKRTSTGTLSTLVAPSRFAGKVIPPGKHFLIGNDGGYAGAVAADIVWPASYTFSRTNNALLIYDPSGRAIDLVSWSEIPSGKSYSRLSSDGNTFIVADPSPRNSSM